MENTEIEVLDKAGAELLLNQTKIYIDGKTSEITDNLATVATSGNYNDLNNKPNFIIRDYTELFDDQQNRIDNFQDIFGSGEGKYQITGNNGLYFKQGDHIYKYASEINNNDDINNNYLDDSQIRFTDLEKTTYITGTILEELFVDGLNVCSTNALLKKLLVILNDANMIPKQ